MLSTLAAIASLATTAHSMAIHGGCSFHLHADGSTSGPVGQLESGQARYGRGLEATEFHLYDDVVVDDHGHGCWWTPPTKVLQCDPGQVPEDGWLIGCDGTVTFRGQSTFYDCDAGDGQYNIYRENGHGVNCHDVTLTADGCHAECHRPRPKTCPADLKGPFEFPHLIIPIDSTKPTTAFATSYNGEISPTVSSIFNFDIPWEDKGKLCSLVFLFPEKKDLETSSFSLSGSGALSFESLVTVAKEGVTSYNNAPAVKFDLGTITVSPGNSYTISTFACPAGEAISFQIKEPEGCDTCLWWFQDFNPSPIGLYITKC